MVVGGTEVGLSILETTGIWNFPVFASTSVSQKEEKGHRGTGVPNKMASECSYK